ncbi:MAG: type II toxin-antitoxin system prevent-host-death family antitoxin [Dehalococcoidia bacterium]|nr:type II toxin-antitoxin system prevent-host-death family antitoxin [Dehalococcoidia bacterium]
MSEGDQTNKWQLQEAKARFSALVEDTIENGPQIVTKRGIEAVVVVPYDQWLNLEQQQVRKPKYRNLKEWLLAPEPRFDLPIPSRRKYRRRPPPTFS